MAYAGSSSISPLLGGGGSGDFLHQRPITLFAHAFLISASLQATRALRLTSTIPYWSYAVLSVVMTSWWQEVVTRHGGHS